VDLSKRYEDSVLAVNYLSLNIARARFIAYSGLTAQARRRPAHVIFESSMSIRDFAMSLLEFTKLEILIIMPLEIAIFSAKI
jgi:hypothetical protein